MAGVVVGGRGADADAVADRRGRARQRHGFLGVEALGEEDRAEAEILGRAHLVEQGAGARGVPGQSVAAQFRETLRARVVTTGGRHVLG